MNQSWSFAILFDKLSRIEQQSRPKYKSAVPNWFIPQTLHVLNLIIRFGTCKVRRLKRALGNNRLLLLSGGKGFQKSVAHQNFSPRK